MTRIFYVHPLRIEKKLLIGNQHRIKVRCFNNSKEKKIGFKRVIGAKKWNGKETENQKHMEERKELDDTKNVEKRYKRKWGSAEKLQITKIRNEIKIKIEIIFKNYKIKYKY